MNMNKIDPSIPIPSIPLSGEIKSSSQDPVTSLALTTLNDKESSEGINNLQDKSIKEQTGGFSSIKHFYNRLFGKVSAENKKIAQDIKTFISDIEQTIEQTIHEVNNLAKPVANGEKLSNDQLKTRLKEAKKSLEAKTLLIENQKVKAENLNNEHICFKDLPRLLNQIEREVAFLNARITVAEEILNLETAVKDYVKPEGQKTWDEFAKIQSQRNELTDTIETKLNNPILEKDFRNQKFREIKGIKEKRKTVLEKQLKENPNIKNDPNFERREDRAIFNPTDVHQIIIHTFPGLRVQTESLFNQITTIQEERIKKLNQRSQSVKIKLQEYNKLSNSIDGLNHLLERKSVWSRIYNVLFGKKNLEIKVDNKTKDQNKIYSEIENEMNHFNNPAEIDWLDKVIRSTYEHQDIKENISSIQKEFNSITKSLKLKEDDKKLNNFLKNQEKNKELNQKNDTNSVDLVDSENLSEVYPESEEENLENSIEFSTNQLNLTEEEPLNRRISISSREDQNEQSTQDIANMIISSQKEEKEEKEEQENSLNNRISIIFPVLEATSSIPPPPPFSPNLNVPPPPPLPKDSSSVNTSPKNSESNLLDQIQKGIQLKKVVGERIDDSTMNKRNSTSIQDQLGNNVDAVLKKGLNARRKAIEDEEENAIEEDSNDWNS